MFDCDKTAFKTYLRQRHVTYMKYWENNHFNISLSLCIFYLFFSVSLALRGTKKLSAIGTSVSGFAGRITAEWNTRA